jgi:hypothetical protein
MTDDKTTRAPQRRASQGAVIRESERIAEWLKNVMRSQTPPLSAEQWGRMAGVTPTTITRFIKDGYPIPKQTTLAALARAVGLQPPHLALAVGELVDVPVILSHVWRVGGEGRAVREAAEFTRTSSRFAGCAAVRITTDTASLAGILPGDLVIFDSKRSPQPGELVVVALDTGEAAVFECQAPWLVARAPGMHTPMLMKAAHIMGVAVQVQRDLPTRG